jgi:hypothetical protein
MNADFYMDAIRILKAKGFTSLEIVEHFGYMNLFNAACSKGAKESTPLQMDLYLELRTADAETKRDVEFKESIHLWLAGWTSHPKEGGRSYWRAPPKGNRRLGRKYPSSRTAFWAMRGWGSWGHHLLPRPACV